MLEVIQIHNSPTPTHHPANPVNSKNLTTPRRRKCCAILSDGESDPPDPLAIGDAPQNLT